jgi:hypothetical protein
LKPSNIGLLTAIISFCSAEKTALSGSADSRLIFGHKLAEANKKGLDF